MIPKIPPNDVDAEKCVLGIIVADNVKFHDISGLLEVEDFYDRNHQIIYSAIKDMFLNGTPVDFITLKDEINKQGKLDDVGGIPYIAKLADDITSTANIEHYARIIKKKSMLRKLIIIGNDTLTKGFEAKEDPEDLIDKFHTSLINIRFSDKRELRLITDGLENKVEELRRKKSDPGFGGISTGFHGLDGLIGKLKKQNYITIAARPSIGKTALALTMMRNMASEGKRILFFSLEMSCEQIQDRLLALQARIDTRAFRDGMDDEDELVNVENTIKQVDDLEIYINDNSLSIEEIDSLSSKYKSAKDIDIIFVDYLQIVGVKQKFDNDNQKVGIISGRLKKIAKDIDVPLVALSQLNRSLEKRKVKRPILSDLRDSGTLEQDSDIVVMLYNDYLYRLDEEKMKSEEYTEIDEEKEKKEEMPDSFEIELLIRKNRNGPIGSTELNFLKKYTLFSNKDDWGVPF